MRLLPLLLLSLPAWAHPLEAFDANVRRGLVPQEGRVVVRAAPGVDAAALQAVAPTLGCAWDHQWGPHAWHTLDCPAVVQPRALLAAWADRPEIAWAQVPFEAELLATPNDLVGRQWHHHNTGQSIGGRTGTAGADIGSLDAWDVTTGDASVVVAVIDSGVYLGHDELQGRIARPLGEVCDNGVDDDGNGYIDDCTGWDVGDDDPDPDPRDLPDTADSGRSCAPFHGTFIAGLVAAAADNGAGGAGVLWDGRILPIKMVSDDGCRLFDTTIAEAMLYAVDADAAVINASWSFGGTSAALAAAFAETEDAGVLVTIAAGNAGTDVDTLETYPIDFDLDTQIVVAATDNRDQRAGFSNWGARDVDLAAPGWRMWSLGIDSPTQHTTANGTSFAAPLVAGAAALVASAYPELRPRDLRRALVDGAAPVPALDCARTARCVATGARLDIPGALDEADRIASTPEATLELLTFADLEGGDGDGVPERGEDLLVRLHVRNTGYAPLEDLSATLALAHPHVAVTTPTIILGGIEPGAIARPADSPAFSVGLSCDEDTDATLTLTLTDEATGEAWTDVRTVPIPCLIDDDADGVPYPEDCDDDDDRVFPGAEERCNDRDDDCDGTVDEDDAFDAVAWYPDADDDGFGAPGEPATACAAPDGYGEGDQDCDDADPAVFPGAEEVCNGLDDDCDDRVDDDATDAVPLYTDADGDGWGDGPEVIGCPQDPALTDRPGDCDDTDPAAFPGSDTHRLDCTERACTGCAAGPSGAAAWLALVGLLGLGRRRR